jgi:arylsulfatase A-like enzyme
MSNRTPLAALALLAACGGEPSAPPSVLLVTLDCLRADRIGAYGYGRDTTPNLDRLAAQSALFERAYSHAPFTAPSHASLLTGLNTASHGLVFWGHSLDESAPTFQDLFGAAGYRTGAFLNHPGLPPTGLLQGFGDVATELWGPYQDTLANFFDWLDAGQGPFASWLHLWDVHRPYGYRLWDAESLRHFPDTGREPGAMPYAEQGFGPAHDPAVGRLEAHYNLSREERAAPLPVGRQSRVLTEADLRSIEDRYDNSVQYVDRGVGELLAGLDERGLDHEVVLVITADHGETLREREPTWFTHDPFLYDEVLRVPLLLRLPDGRFAGQRESEALARGIDVLPTLLEVAGLQRPASLQGRSLLGVLDGTDRAPVTLLAQTQTKTAKESARRVDPDGGGPEWIEFRQAVVGGHHKLIVDLETGTERLFDLRADPRELTDRSGAPEAAAELDRLRTELRRYRTSLPVAEVRQVAEAEAQNRLLEAMGYLEPAAGGAR